MISIAFKFYLLNLVANHSGTKNFSIASIKHHVMGFWRGVGYFISVIIIILGFWIFITGFLHFSVYPFPPLFRLGLGSILVILGFVFIWMLKRSAGQERIEKQLKEINERDKERSSREIADRDKDKELPK